jgi:hypothetical protein
VGSAPAIGDGPITIVVTVGETRYELSGEPSTTAACGLNEGFFSATLSTDDILTTIEVVLPPEGYVPDPLYAETAVPRVRVSLYPDGPDWQADANLWSGPPAANIGLEEGLSQVDTFAFDASGASGTATFVDETKLTSTGEFAMTGVSVSGTFEVTCG